MNTRATHRVLTPRHPPLYTLRESDATQTAERRLPASSMVEILVTTAARDEWHPFRAYPS